MAELPQSDNISAQALLFLILTSTRTNEVLQAKWREIDLKAGEWNIPATRIKSGQQHRVPLSKQAIAILESVPRMVGNPYIFLGRRDNKPLSNMALLKQMRDMGYGANCKRGDYVPHGFRSSFRDWTGEISTFPTDFTEMELAHVIENKVEAAYRSGDPFKKREKMMQERENYLYSATKMKRANG